MQLHTDNNRKKSQKFRKITLFILDNKNMVKAADIGKGSRDFVSKDFFAGNEVKVNQGGCGKNTTTFKIGDSIKADHKIDLNKVPFPFTEP